MRTFYGCLIIITILLSNVFADDEQSQYSYITTSVGGRYFFLMKPDPNDLYNRENGTGICYEVTGNGEFKELWRTEGWYSFRTFFASFVEGERPKRLHHYLVRLGNWHRGSKPSADHVGVAFYKDGKLLKSYSTIDLIRNMSAVHPSVSHYEYLDNRYQPALECQYEKGNLIFKLVTIDGVHYQFDVKTGQIAESAEPNFSGTVRYEFNPNPQEISPKMYNWEIMLNEADSKNGNYEIVQITQPIKKDLTIGQATTKTLIDNGTIVPDKDGKIHFNLYIGDKEPAQNINGIGNIGQPIIFSGIGTGKGASNWIVLPGSNIYDATAIEAQISERKLSLIRFIVTNNDNEMFQTNVMLQRK